MGCGCGGGSTYSAENAPVESDAFYWRGAPAPEAPKADAPKAPKTPKK